MQPNRDRKQAIAPGHCGVWIDLSAVLAELFATRDEHTPAENAQRLAHVLMTGELPRRFEWDRRLKAS